MTCTADGCTGRTKARGYCLKHYTRLIRYGSPYGFKRRATPSERFWTKVNKTATCWLWTGAGDGFGYGHFNAGGGRANSVYVKAHRFAYEQLVGPIPKGLHIDHICHNPPCVNPDHLRAVENRINAQNRSSLDSRNTVGYRGVSRRPDGRFRAYIGHMGRQIHLGLYDTAEEAGEVAARARDHYFDLPTESPRRRSA